MLCVVQCQNWKCINLGHVWWTWSPPGRIWSFWKMISSIGQPWSWSWPTTSSSWPFFGKFLSQSSSGNQTFELKKSESDNQGLFSDTSQCSTRLFWTALRTKKSLEPQESLQLQCHLDLHYLKTWVMAKFLHFWPRMKSMKVLVKLFDLGIHLKAMKATLCYHLRNQPQFLQDHCHPGHVYHDHGSS